MASGFGLTFFSFLFFSSFYLFKKKRGMDLTPVASNDAPLLDTYLTSTSSYALLRVLLFQDTNYLTYYS